MQAYKGVKFNVCACVLKEYTVRIGFRIQHHTVGFGIHDVNIRFDVEQIEYETGAS